MLKKLLKNNLGKSVALLITLILFVSLIFPLNAHLKESDEAIGAFNSMPMLLKLIFMIMIPVFGNFKYLYQFIMIYIIPITLIYSFYLGYTVNTENQIENTMPINKNKRKLYYLIAPYIHILVIILTLMITTMISTSASYSYFYPEVINGFVNLLFWNSAIYVLALIFRRTKKKSKLIVMASVGIYLVLALLLTSVANINWFYYLSPLNILLQPSNNPLIYLIPVGICLSLLVIYFMKKHQQK